MFIYGNKHYYYYYYYYYYYCHQSHLMFIVYQIGGLCGGAHEISGIKAPLFLCGWGGGWWGRGWWDGG